MNLSLTTLLMIVIPLLLLEGLFSGSEIALLSADKIKLQTRAKNGSKRAKLALELSSHPERVLSATLLVVSVCVIGISSLISLFLLSSQVANPELTAVLITSPLVVIFGELIPKTVYQRYSDQMAPWVSLPVVWAYYAFYPITRLLASYTTRLSRMLGPIEELVTGRKRSTREDLLSLLSYGKRETEIKSSEKRMIKRIFDFKDSEAKHAFIPLVKMEAIEDTVTIREALERFKSHRHSRMPVYSQRIDNIVGLLEVSDLFATAELDHPLTKYITPAHYVAETQALRDLLMEMSRDDNEMVVVVDEYGGAVGILTFEDIVEEIVGEINDEYDSESAPYRELAPNQWLVQARMEIQLINERLRLEVPEGDYETIGGFLLQQFSRIPEQGDELYFDTSQGLLKFTVRKASERQIESVLIELTQTETDRKTQE